MAIKKSEIYSQIWAACDKLRGGVEPARYKDYILTLLFVKYVSDRFKSSDNWDIEVPEGGSFDDVIALKYKKNIGEGINIIIGKLAEANDLKGIIDIADFNSEELGTDKEAVDKLSGLVEIFQKCCTGFCYRNGFKPCLTHRLYKVAHVRCPWQFIAGEFAAIVVAVELVSPVGFQCTSAHLFGIIFSSLSDAFKVGSDFFVHGSFLRSVFRSVSLAVTVYYHTLGRIASR